RDSTGADGRAGQVTAPDPVEEGGADVIGPAVQPALQRQHQLNRIVARPWPLAPFRPPMAVVDEPPGRDQHPDVRVGAANRKADPSRGGAATGTLQIEGHAAEKFVEDTLALFA